PAIGAWIELVGIDELKGFTQSVRDFLRGFNGMRCNVDGPHHYLFAAKEFNKVNWDMRVLAFKRDDIDIGFLQLGERFLILTPLGPQGLFPISVGLNAVAIANMDSRFALKTFDCPLKGSD